MRPKGTPPKHHFNPRICRKCLCNHCICDVDTSKHFIPTKEELEEWYGEDDS